jgi:DNA polymerase-1
MQMSMEKKKSLYLIDGSSYIYRAFYALTRLTNARGMPTNAIYGFARMILKVIRDKAPDYVCVVFDAPGPSFRHEMYDEYKASRQKMPEDLVLQVPYIKEMVKYHGIPQIEMEGYEADDLIATLTRTAIARDLEVVIVSADKDLHQLIDAPRVLQWDPQKDKVFDEKAVEEKFGITPRQVGDYLALTGDSSDNIPGVKGVGDKTARELLRKWGSLEEIFGHIGRVTPESVKKKLSNGRESAHLSRKLVELKSDIPMGYRIEDCVPSPPMRKELMALYEELDFKQLLEALREESAAEGKDAVGEQATTESRTCGRIVKDLGELSELARRLEKQEELSIDVETTSRDSMSAGLVGIALSFEENDAYYIPVGHRGPEDKAQLPAESVLGTLEPLLKSAKPGKIGQNIKSALIVLKRHGIQLSGVAFDTMVASYMLDPGRGSHDLERLAAEYLGEKKLSYSDVTGSGRNHIGFEKVGTTDAAEYACGSAGAAWRLAPVLRESLRSAGLDDLYQSLELPLISILAEMEYRGILVDTAKLESLSFEFEEAMDLLAASIYDMAKEEFNIQSPKQLSYILFEKLGLRVVKKTKTGPSTDTSVLEQLALEHPIVEQVLAYRSIAKLKGTYADALPKLVHPETARIHTSFNQAVTATGRLSSSDPNLQNIPIRSAEGRKLRSAFIAPVGHVLLSADYSQIELRILAHYSKDEHLLDAFRNGTDVHLQTAAEMLNVPPHEVTPEMRRQAKMINFGIIYGMGPYGLAQRLRISQKIAKAAIDRYFERYHGVRRYIDSTVQSARKTGHAITLLGRKRKIPELQSRNFTVRQQGERLAVNTPIQGTAADLIKKAMIDVDGALKERGLKTAMLLQVHDELVFEVPLEELELAKGLIRESMESVWKIDVPLRIEMGWAENWADAHP